MGFPLFFVLKSTGNISFAAMGMIVVMMPMFFLAMYEKDGQPLEVVAKHFYESRFKRPKVRPYKTNNYYAAVMRQYQAAKEVERIVCNREKDPGSRSQALRKEKEGA